MRTTPGSYLSQQYNTIKAMFEDKLIIESICVLQDLSTQYCKEKVHTFAPEIFL